MIRVVSEARDIELLPKPNSITLIFSDRPPPTELITSALGLVFANGAFLMTRLRARGWDIPGGHVKPGETPADAMVREVREETGIEVSPIRLLGYQRIRIEGDVSDDYPYPVPGSYQVFFLAAPVSDHGLVPSDEVVEARFLPLSKARDHEWTKATRDLFEEALAHERTA